MTTSIASVKEMPALSRSGDFADRRRISRPTGEMFTFEGPNGWVEPYGAVAKW
jgi:hypothetical protein